jgi:2-isopropylmalate synthase
MAVDILDSTLREGEQTRGVAFRLEDKLAIAQQLDALGVRYIEAGHPAVSPRIAEAVRRVAGLGLQADIVAHARAMRSDVDAALACDVDWVGIFFSVADRRLEQQFRKDEAQAIALVTDVVQYAKDHGLKVRYTPEDTVRSDYGRVVRVARAAVEAGADRISVADTTGYMTPLRMHDFIARLVADVGPRVHAHCHNDLGLGVANALAAAEAGAIVVDACVNGLGERAGLADTATLATALALRVQGAPTLDLPRLPELADLVAEASGFPIHPLAPIVGRNAFSHNAGLHVAAVLQDPGHYESIPASLVGRQRYIVVDQFSGRDAVRHRLAMLGAQATDAEVELVLRIVKERCLNDVSDGDLALLLFEARRNHPSPHPTAPHLTPPSTPSPTPQGAR